MTKGSTLSGGGNNKNINKNSREEQKNQDKN
jgi:hypothetical protein